MNASPLRSAKERIRKLKLPQFGGHGHPATGSRAVCRNAAGQTDTVHTSVSFSTRPLIPAGADHTHMIMCPSSIGVKRLDRRSDSTTAPAIPST